MSKLSATTIAREASLLSMWIAGNTTSLGCGTIRGHGHHLAGDTRVTVGGLLLESSPLSILESVEGYELSSN